MRPWDDVERRARGKAPLGAVAACVAALLLAPALGGCAAHPPPPEGREAAAPEPTRTESTAVTEPTMTYGTRDWAPGQCRDWVIVDRAFSGSDDTDLVGFSDNVFVGRVEERVGSAGPSRARPFGTTRFCVEVLENVKGRLGGTVTVAQEGSRDPGRGCLMLADDDPLLRRGQDVVFFTRRDEGRGWHQIVAPGYGDVRVGSEREREELVRRFERAEERQTAPLPRPGGAAAAPDSDYEVTGDGTLIYEGDMALDCRELRYEEGASLEAHRERVHVCTEAGFPPRGKPLA